MKYKYHSSINLTAAEQGLIYFSCQNQKRLPPKKQIYILNLCIKVGGEHTDALLETLTTDATMLFTANNHYIDVSCLWRLVKKFYEEFDVEAFERYYDKKERIA